MESKNRSGAVKSKRSKRRLLTKSDNYIISNEKNKIIDKHTLKTRGPYVVRNPVKLNTSDNLEDEPKPKNRTDKKEVNRKYSSTVVTSSFLGNRKFITHDIVKNKRKNKNNTQAKLQDLTKSSIISDIKSNTKNFKPKMKSQSSYKKKSKEKDVIYVLPSRNNNYLSVTNTMSIISKPDYSPSNINNKEMHQSCSRIDRIADEVLEGWMKRKEKMKTSEQTIMKEQPDEVFDLCLDFPETNDTIQEKLSTCKTEKTYIKANNSTARYTTNLYDIDLSNHDIPKKFYIIEEDNEKPIPKPRFKKPKITVKHNLKTQSLIHSKQPKVYNKKTHSHKNIKRSSKKEFINFIKKELEDTNIYKDPHDMFDALKTLAKHRNKNHISFVDGIASNTKWWNPECDYDNPKLLNSFKKIISKNKTFNKTPRKGIKTSTLEVKNFQKTPDNRLQIITI